jgi:hypothetical protein
VIDAATLPELFADTPVPNGPISDEAADAIAAILWAAWERDQHQAGGQQSPLENPVTLAGAPG